MWHHFNQNWICFRNRWGRKLHTLSRSTVPSVSIRPIFIHPRPLLHLSDWIKRGVIVALCRHQDFGTCAGFHRESICLWRSSYIRLCHHHKIWSRKSFVWGPTDRPATQQYSQRKTQGGEHCCLLVNLCCEEIVRGITCVCSENLDLLRIYICVWKFLLTMGAIKSKQRSCLTDQHLTDFLRAAITEQQPDLKLLAKKMHTQSSH